MCYWSVNRILSIFCVSAVVGGCALTSQPTYGPNDLQKAIMAEDDSRQLDIIWRGNYSDITHRGGYPTAAEMLLAGSYWLTEIIKTHGLEATLAATSLDKKEKQNLACKHGSYWDADPVTRPILYKFGDLDEPCPTNNRSLRALLHGHNSHETNVWAYGKNYKRDWHLITLKYDFRGLEEELYVDDRPADYGYTNQEVLKAALIGGKEVLIDRIIGFGGDLNEFTRDEWQDIICQSFETGLYYHESDMFRDWIKRYGSDNSACSPYYRTALEWRRPRLLIGALQAKTWDTESPEFTNMLAEIVDYATRDQSEYRDEVNFVTSAAEGLGRDALHPPLAEHILLNRRALHIIASELNSVEKHALSCQLLAQKSPLTESLKGIVGKSVVLARRCDDGRLPIMVASPVPDNFEFVYNLDPAVYRRQVTKTEVLKAALDTGKPELIKAVADRSGNLLANLESRDLRGVMDQPDLLLELESRGLPTKHRVYAELAGRCHPIEDKEYVGLINQSFFTSYVTPLSNSAQHNDGRNIVLAAYSNCLENRAGEIEAISPFRNSDDEPPEVSEDIYAHAKARTLHALSLIAPRDHEDQDPVRARDIIYAGYDSIRANVARFGREVNEYAALQKEKLDQAQQEALRRREEGHDEVSSATWKGLGVTALIGGVMLYNDLDASEVVEMGVNTTMEWRKAQTQQIDREFVAAIKAIQATEIEIPRIEDLRTTNLDEDGVRLLVPRYGANSPYGSLNVEASYDHTHAVVRLKTSNGGRCTGAVLSGQRILTAQHCIVDHNLEVFDEIEISSDYFSVSNGMLFYTRRSYSGPWKYKTAESRYANGPDEGVTFPQNDWALLEPVNKSDRRIPDFMKGSHLDMMDPVDVSKYLKQRLKLTVAGYAGHLNSGAYLTMDWGCSVAWADERVIEDHCLGFKGDSGSPVVASEGALKGQIVGVRSYGRWADGEIESRTPTDEMGSVSIAHVQNELEAGRFIAGVIE